MADSGLFSDELGQGVLRKFTNLGRVMAEDVENSIRKAVAGAPSHSEMDDKDPSSSSERKYADEDQVGDDSEEDSDEDSEDDDDDDDDDVDDDDDDVELEDEWENDDDAGFILVPISEEEFFDLEEVSRHTHSLPPCPLQLTLLPPLPPSPPSSPPSPQAGGQ